MINRNLIKQFRQNCRAATIVHPLSRRNFANSDSWAAKELAAKGESITPVVGKKFIAINRSSVSHPSDKIKALAEEILHLNALETTALWKNIQVGVTNEEFMGAMPGGGGRGSSAVKETVQEAVAAPEPVKEKEIFDIKIGAVDAAVKLKVIKEVRTITGLGLKEAKELVEKAPIVIKKGLKKEEIDAVKKVLLAVGATVEVL